MKYILKSLLIIGIAVGGVIALLEYFGGVPATTTSSASSTSWFVTILSSPWTLLSITAIGVFLLLAISVWRKAGETAGGFFWNKEKNDLTPFGRLLAVIAFVMWFVFAVNYVHDEPWINNFFFGVSERDRWVIVVILVALAHLPLSPLANFIVPTKGAFMRAVVYAVFVVVIAYAGSRAHTTHDFFNSATGDSTAYIDSTTNKPYYHDGWAPDTGEKLIAITKEAAREIKNRDLVSLAKKKAEGWLKDTLSKESPAPPPPAAPPAPPKEEKTMIAAKEKRWREATNEEEDRIATYPVGRGTALLKAGEAFEIPQMGKGSCVAAWIEGEAAVEGIRVKANGGAPVATNCNNLTISVVAVGDNTRLTWGACLARSWRCLKYE